MVDTADIFDWKNLISIRNWTWVSENGQQPRAWVGPTARRCFRIRNPKLADVSFIILIIIHYCSFKSRREGSANKGRLKGDQKDIDSSHSACTAFPVKAFDLDF
jgi:hypothetical protein